MSSKEWKVCKEDGTNREFYYNTITKESTWDKPDALLSAEDLQAKRQHEKSQRDFFDEMERNILAHVVHGGGEGAQGAGASAFNGRAASRRGSGAGEDGMLSPAYRDSAGSDDLVGDSTEWSAQSLSGGSQGQQAQGPPRGQGHGSSNNGKGSSSSGERRDVQPSAALAPQTFYSPLDNAVDMISVPVGANASGRGKDDAKPKPVEGHGSNSRRSTASDVVPVAAVPEVPMSAFRANSGGTKKPSPVPENEAPSHPSRPPLRRSNSTGSIHFSVRGLTLGIAEEQETIHYVCSVFRAKMVLGQQAHAEWAQQQQREQQEAQRRHTLSAAATAAAHQDFRNSLAYENFAVFDDRYRSGAAGLGLLTAQSSSNNSINRNFHAHPNSLNATGVSSRAGSNSNVNSCNNSINRNFNTSGGGVSGRLPSVADVEAFYTEMFEMCQLEGESILSSLIYCDRFLAVFAAVDPRFYMHAGNWRPIVLTCMLLASKFTDDHAMLNDDFARAVRRTVRAAAHEQQLQHTASSSSGVCTVEHSCLNSPLSSRCRVPAAALSTASGMLSARSSSSAASKRELYSAAGDIATSSGAGNVNTYMTYVSNALEGSVGSTRSSLVDSYKKAMSGVGSLRGRSGSGFGSTGRRSRSASYNGGSGSGSREDEEEEEDQESFSSFYSKGTATGAGVKYSLQRINQLEVAFLCAISYNVRVTPTEYATYYFYIRMLREKLKTFGKPAGLTTVGSSSNGGNGSSRSEETERSSDDGVGLAVGARSLSLVNKPTHYGDDGGLGMRSKPSAHPAADGKTTGNLLPALPMSKFWSALSSSSATRAVSPGADEDGGVFGQGVTVSREGTPHVLRPDNFGMHTFSGGGGMNRCVTGTGSNKASINTTDSPPMSSNNTARPFNSNSRSSYNSSTLSTSRVAGEPSATTVAHATRNSRGEGMAAGAGTSPEGVGVVRHGGSGKDTQNVLLSSTEAVTSSSPAESPRLAPVDPDALSATSRCVVVGAAAGGGSTTPRHVSSLLTASLNSPQGNRTRTRTNSGSNISGVSNGAAKDPSPSAAVGVGAGAADEPFGSPKMQGGSRSRLSRLSQPTPHDAPAAGRGAGAGTRRPSGSSDLMAAQRQARGEQFGLHDDQGPGLQMAQSMGHGQGMTYQQQIARRLNADQLSSPTHGHGHGHVQLDPASTSSAMSSGSNSNSNSQPGSYGVGGGGGSFFGGMGKILPELRGTPTHQHQQGHAQGQGQVPGDPRERSGSLGSGSHSNVSHSGSFGSSGLWKSSAPPSNGGQLGQGQGQGHGQGHPGNAFGSPPAHSIGKVGSGSSDSNSSLSNHSNSHGQGLLSRVTGAFKAVVNGASSTISGASSSSGGGGSAQKQYQYQQQLHLEQQQALHLQQQEELSFTYGGKQYRDAKSTGEQRHQPQSQHAYQQQHAKRSQLDSLEPYSTSNSITSSSGRFTTGGMTSGGSAAYSPDEHVHSISPAHHNRRQGYGSGTASGNISGLFPALGSNSSNNNGSTVSANANARQNARRKYGSGGSDISATSGAERGGGGGGGVYSNNSSFNPHSSSNTVASATVPSSAQVIAASAPTYPRKTNTRFN